MSCGACRWFFFIILALVAGRELTHSHRIPIWLNVVVVLVLIGAQLLGWEHWAEAAYDSEDERRTGDKRLTRIFWPLRISSFLISISVGLYIYTCFDTPPLGSRPLVISTMILMWLGFASSRWE